MDMRLTRQELLEQIRPKIDVVVRVSRELGARALAHVSPLPPIALPQWVNVQFAKLPKLPKEKQRYVAVLLVVVLHASALWILASSLKFVRPGDHISELQVDLVSPSIGGAPRIPTPTAPELVQPKAVLVAEPEIQVASEPRPPSPVTAIDMTQVLPPRPDPTHVNQPPHLPTQFRVLGSAVSAVLRIFVQPDGSISDAQVTHSTGNHALDQMVLAYVKENWRFISANAHGYPVPDWTTVLVPFKAA